MELQGHQYYALLGKYVSVKWVDHTGPWPNDLNAIVLAMVVNSMEAINSVLDPACYYTKAAAQHVGHVLQALGLQGTMPLQFVESVKVFIMLSVFCVVSWTLLRYIFDATWPAFHAIAPQHKQWYVIANLSKAAFLGVMVLSGSWWTWSFRVYWENQKEYPNHILMLAKYAAMCYVVTDAVALFMVPKLPRSTVIHHYTSFILALYISAFDWRKGDVVHMINMYGFFSTLAFTTNAFLALRVMYYDREWMKLVAELSLWTYALACLGNWAAHALWLVGEAKHMNITVPIVLYSLMLPNIVQDDIVLMKWLWGAARGTNLRRPSAEKEDIAKASDAIQNGTLKKNGYHKTGSDQNGH